MTAFQVGDKVEVTKPIYVYTGKTGESGFPPIDGTYAEAFKGRVGVIIAQQKMDWWLVAFVNDSHSMSFPSTHLTKLENL